jgi:hypothetical protein
MVFALDSAGNQQPRVGAFVTAATLQFVFQATAEKEKRKNLRAKC